MKKTLSSLKVEEDLERNMQSANKKLNTINLTHISFAEYRRFCYFWFSQFVLQEKPDKIKKALLR